MGREFKEWTRRSLKGDQYVYQKADGVHYSIRLDEDHQCILVLMGTMDDVRRALVAIADGYRESKQSWTRLLLDVPARG